jgi:spermidine synthase
MDVEASDKRRASSAGCRLHFWLGAVWSGAVVMSFELVGGRLLMPTFGMGIEVWAAVIATTLGALAIGYWAGGRLADARPSASSLAWVLLLTGASLFCVRLGHHRIMACVADWPFVVGAWCSAAAILCVPLVLLGMVQPVLARLLFRSADRTGRLVGALLAAGTIGGVVGTALTGVVLIPRVGVAWTLLCLASGTAVVAAITWLGERRLGPAGVAVLFALASAGVARPSEAGTTCEGAMTILEQVDGLYGHLEVVECQGAKALLCDGIFQTALPHSATGITRGALLRGGDYVELIPYLRPGTKTALLIGLGGGLHEQALATYGISVHAVEIEPAVVGLATRHFGLAADVTVEDGRAFLTHDRRQFDAIILDAFLGSSIPEHLFTREAFAQMAGHLTSGGILAVHLVSRPQHAATRAVAGTLRTVFTNMVAVCGGRSDELQHVYLFASQGPLDLPPEQRTELAQHGFTGRELRDIDAREAPLLVDDRPCLAWLGRDLVIEHRRQSLERRRRLSW